MATSSLFCSHASQRCVRWTVTIAPDAVCAYARLLAHAGVQGGQAVQEDHALDYSGTACACSSVRVCS